MNQRLRSHDGDRDRGATLVEFALIAPLFFLLLGSMLDIGLAVLGRSVASNAAREGARVGIIQFDDAHLGASPAYAAIKAAAEAKLVGLVAPDTSAPAFVEVRCLHGVTKSPLGGTGTCARNAVTIDRDLIEVTVKWTSIAPAGGIFTPDTYVDRARMVIIGDGGGGAGACTGSGGPISISPAAPAPDEGDDPDTLTLTLTVTRQFPNCLTTVSYSTADVTATAPDDYVAIPPTPLIFLDGETSKTFDIEIVGDSVTEGPETFTVNLANPVNGTIGIGTALVTIVDDDISLVPPARTYLRMYDLDADGKVDQVTAGFDKDIEPTCPSQGAFSFPSNPNGVSLQSLTFTGPREVTLALDEGTADTSASALTVALAAGCVRDAFGNSATFGATAPDDLAAPVPLSLVDSNGATDGKFEPGDYLEFTFSEPMNPASISAATTNVVLDGGNGSNDDEMAAVVLFSGAPSTGNFSLGDDKYMNKNKGVATFASSGIAFNTGNTKIRLTLGAACAGDCGTNLTVGQGTVTFTFVAGLRGADGAPPAVTQITAPNFKLF